jgi:hypothetical protein
MQYVERNRADPNSRHTGTAALVSQPAFTENGLCEDRWVLSDKIYLFTCTVFEKKKKKLVRLPFSHPAQIFRVFCYNLVRASYLQ